MRKIIGVLFALIALASLSLTLVGGVSPEPHAIPSVLVIPTSTSTDLPTATATLTDKQVFDTRVKALNPSLRKYVRKLYVNYQQDAWKYKAKGSLQRYIRRQHRYGEHVFHYYKDPMKWSDTWELSYAVVTYTNRWKMDIDWAVALWTQESDWVNLYGDKINYKTHKPNKPSSYSIGIGQVKLDSAKGNLEARGIDSTGLTVDDLLYFRLMNMDISACIMAAKIRDLGLKHGLEAYNAGDNGWHDGRSNQYYKDILAIHKTKAQWHEK